MPDQRERLRRISNYSWHVLRADAERERAIRASDSARPLHLELARLHLGAANDLSDAWRPVSDFPRIGESAEIRIRRMHATLAAALSDPDQPRQRIPSTITVEAERIT